MRESVFTEEVIAIAQLLHASGLVREWKPGDRLIGGEPPVRVVRSVSVDGDPLVEVERGGRVQTVGVAHPRIWLPTTADILTVFAAQGCEGAMMFRGGKFAFKFRPVDQGEEYRMVTGSCPRVVSYQALLMFLEQKGTEPTGGSDVKARVTA